MNMELQTIEIWIMFLTLILAPVIYSIRENSHENKRIDVLLNKTREEVARDYVTKEELETSMDRVVRMLNKLESKLDKLFEVKQ
tara:strand:- start:130 stop:381 length:252 start_codon:yes stop_codon:yes gene_type:complete